MGFQANQQFFQKTLPAGNQGVTSGTDPFISFAAGGGDSTVESIVFFIVR
jgi:hypothetical protein